MYAKKNTKTIKRIKIYIKGLEKGEKLWQSLLNLR